MVNRSAPLFPSSLCSGHKMQTTNWKLIFPPFKTHMHFHLRGFMVVDLPGSGNGCLPADENHLLRMKWKRFSMRGKSTSHNMLYFILKALKLFGFAINRTVLFFFFPTWITDVINTCQINCFNQNGVWGVCAGMLSKVLLLLRLYFTLLSGFQLMRTTQLQVTWQPIPL